jgi:hypothetical protein
MQRREILLIVVSLALIAGVWTSCSVLNNEALDETAPVKRTPLQNQGANAPHERVPSPNAADNPANPE